MALLNILVTDDSRQAYQPMMQLRVETESLIRGNINIINERQGTQILRFMQLIMIFNLPISI